jgi:superfamily II DNA/RNA helicase
MMERGTCPGRTGRFGRKGISINFVHDKNTWAQMEEIEKATGEGITRIETTDLDEVLWGLNTCRASTLLTRTCRALPNTVRGLIVNHMAI